MDPYSLVWLGLIELLRSIWILVAMMNWLKESQYMDFQLHCADSVFVGSVPVSEKGIHIGSSYLEFGTSWGWVGLAFNGAEPSIWVDGYRFF